MAPPPGKHSFFKPVCSIIGGTFAPQLRDVYLRYPVALLLPNYPITVAETGFSRGASTLIIQSNFPENYMKTNKIGPGEGSHPKYSCVDPPLYYYQL